MPSVSGLNPGEMIGLCFFGMFVIAAAMMLCARLAGIRDATVGRSFTAALAASVATCASLQAAQAIRGLWGLAIILAGAALVVHFIRLIFHTTTGKALVTYFANVLIQMIVAGLMMRMAGGIG